MRRLGRCKFPPRAGVSGTMLGYRDLTEQGELTDWTTCFKSTQKVSWVDRCPNVQLLLRNQFSQCCWTPSAGAISTGGVAGLQSVWDVAIFLGSGSPCSKPCCNCTGRAPIWLCFAVWVELLVDCFWLASPVILQTAVCLYGCCICACRLWFWFVGPLQGGHWDPGSAKSGLSP